MVLQLFRTKFESNLMSFIVFIALIIAAGARHLLKQGVAQGPLPRESLMMAAAWLMLCCIAAGLVSLLRQNRERSGRLYAQLPVSPRQDRSAYWLHVLLYPALAALLLKALILFGGSEPAPPLFQIVPTAFFLSCMLWLACLALITSNIRRAIPDAVRNNTVLYCAIVLVATYLLGGALILAVVLILGEDNYTRIFSTQAVLGLALVTLDIHLFGKNDSSLA